MPDRDLVYNIIQRGFMHPNVHIYSCYLSLCCCSFSVSVNFLDSSHWAAACGWKRRRKTVFCQIRWAWRRTETEQKGIKSVMTASIKHHKQTPVGGSRRGYGRWCAYFLDLIFGARSCMWGSVRNTREQKEEEDEHGVKVVQRSDQQVKG